MTEVQGDLAAGAVVVRGEVNRFARNDHARSAHCTAIRKLGAVDEVERRVRALRRDRPCAWEEEAAQFEPKRGVCEYDPALGDGELVQGLHAQVASALIDDARGVERARAAPMQELHVRAHYHGTERVVGEVGVAGAVVVRGVSTRQDGRKEQGRIHREGLLPLFDLAHGRDDFERDRVHLPRAARVVRGKQPALRRHGKPCRVQLVAHAEQGRNASDVPVAKAQQRVLARDAVKALTWVLEHAALEARSLAFEVDTHRHRVAVEHRGAVAPWQRGHHEEVPMQACGERAFDGVQVQVELAKRAMHDRARNRHVGSFRKQVLAQMALRRPTSRFATGLVTSLSVQ